MTTDVLVIGGGVIGLTTAYELAQAGRRVVVCDRGPLGKEASWAGAGIIPPGNPKRAAEPLEKLRAVSAVLWSELATKLQIETGIDVGYRVCGGVEFFTDQDGPPLSGAWSAEGIEFEGLTTSKLQRLEPHVKPPPATAIHFPTLAQVRNPRHLKALELALARLGVVLAPNRGVNGFSIRGGKIIAADAHGGAFVADQYLICAGPWTRRLVGAFGTDLPIFPVRGQMVLMNTGTPIVSRVLMHGIRYIVPRDDGHVLVGSTEDHVGFNRKTVGSDLHDLRDFAIALVPDLAKAEDVSSWAGLRPATADGLPFLGPLPEVENAWVAAGHFRAGIQTSPGTGRALCQALCGDTPIIPLEPFRLDRPAGKPARPTFRT